MEAGDNTPAGAGLPAKSPVPHSSALVCSWGRSAAGMPAKPSPAVPASRSWSGRKTGFSDAGNLLRKRKKPPFPLKEERLIIRSWKPAPFLKMKKAGILMASHHKNPGRFPNDKFLKTL